jgi:isopenicillin N synthase-like dioxygenase
MLIMPGKLAELLTGGQIKPMYHRVRAVNACPRLSVLFFADIDPDRCEPWVGEGADAMACRAHVLTNAARFGMPGFGLE